MGRFVIFLYTDWMAFDKHALIAIVALPDGVDVAVLPVHEQQDLAESIVSACQVSLNFYSMPIFYSAIITSFYQLG